MKNNLKTSSKIMIFICLLFCIGLCSCKDENLPPIKSLVQINSSDYSIGVQEGTTAANIAKTKFSQAKIKYFSTYPDAYAALLKNKIDAVIGDKPAFEYVIANNPFLVIFPETVDEGGFAIGAPSNRKKLISDVDKFIKQYRSDGTYEDMYNRWLKNKNPVMPSIPAATAPVGVLKVGTEGLYEPMNFYAQNGEVTGFDIEFAQRLALFLNLKLEIETINWSGLLMATQSGKIDLLIASLDKNEENAKVMALSDKYVDSDIVVMINQSRFVSPHSFTAADLNNPEYSIGVPVGSQSMLMAEKLFPKAKINYLSLIADGVQSVKSKKTTAFAFSQPTLEHALLNNPELAFFPDFGIDGHLVIAANKGNKQLIKEVNKFIAQYRADGTYKDMYKRWISGGSSIMPTIAVPKNPTGVLRYGADGLNEPMNFLTTEGKLSGFDAEFAQRFCLFANLKCEAQVMQWDALILGLKTGKLDLMISSLEATEERRENAELSDDYIDNKIGIIVHKDFLKEHSLSAKKTFADLKEKDIGVLTGSIFDFYLKKEIPEAYPKYFLDVSSQIAALKAHKIDGFVVDCPLALLTVQKNQELEIVDNYLAQNDYTMIVSPTLPHLYKQLNSFLRKATRDELLKQLKTKWMNGKEEDKVIDFTVPTGKNGVIVLGVLPEMEPFAYYKDDKIIGYEVELAMLFARQYGYTLEIVPIAADSMIMSIISGKIDILTGMITATPERKKSLPITVPTYSGGINIVVQKNSETEVSNFWETFKNNFKRSLIVENRWKMILNGLGMTILITAASALCGTLLGFVICWLRRGKNSLAVWSSKTFIRLIQGIPIVVFLMVLYYIVFGNINISGVIVAIIAFSINMGVYVAEMLRSGMDSVDKGQIEAAQAMGFSKYNVFRLIVLPQTVKNVMPVYKGEIISLLKGTAIVGYIAIEDLTKMSDIIRSRTYEAFFPLIMTTVIYLIIAYLLIWGLTKIEIKLDPKHRSRHLKGVKEKE